MKRTRRVNVIYQRSRAAAAPHLEPTDAVEGDGGREKWESGVPGCLMQRKSSLRVGAEGSAGGQWVCVVDGCCGDGEKGNDAVLIPLNQGCSQDHSAPPFLAIFSSLVCFSDVGFLDVDAGFGSASRK